MIVKTPKGELPVRYGMNALAKFGDLTDKGMNDVMTCLSDLGKMKISEVLAFVYSGFYEGARYAKEECQVAGPDEAGDMIDEDGGLLTRMFEAYSEDSAPDDVGEGEGKKK
jgi:hypothetical protein